MYALYCKQRERRVKETYSAVNLRTGLNRSDTRSRREGRNSESNWESAPASSLFNRRKLWSFDGTSEANLAALSKLAILSREIGDIIPTIVKKRNPSFRWTSVVVRKHLLVRSNEFEGRGFDGFVLPEFFLRRKFAPRYCVTECVLSSIRIRILIINKSNKIEKNRRSHTTYKECNAIYKLYGVC